MRRPLSSVQKLQRRPRVSEVPAGPLPPNTVLAHCPPTCEGLTPRERQDDRELASELDVPYYDPHIG